MGYLKSCLVLFLCLAGTVSAAAVSGAPVSDAGISTTSGNSADSDPGIQISTRGGLEIATYDGRFSFELGGRLMLDAAFYEDQDTDMGDGSEIRRAYIEMEGTLEDWLYDFSIDFSEDDSEVKNAYVGYQRFRPLILKIGNFKEPFGLEQLTGSNHIMFMERALLEEFTPGRSLGIGAGYSGMNWTASGGFFGQQVNDNVEDEGDAGWGVTGRLTFAPVYSETRLLHLGVASSFRKLDDEEEIRFNSRPESHFTDIRFLDTDKIEDVDSMTKYGFESAAVYGPFSIQGEYIRTGLNRDREMENPQFSGYYAALGWFVTGESRPYDSDEGVFERLKPKRTLGAVELGARYSAMDLTDKEISGGEQENFTLGVNWYLNSKVRFMVNYIWVYNDAEADADGDALGNDDPKILQTRFQLAF